MYKVFGYAVRGSDEPFTRQYHNQLFFSKQEALDFCRQHGRVTDDSIVQLFVFEKLPYVEPKEVN